MNFLIRKSNKNDIDKITAIKKQMFIDAKLETLISPSFSSKVKDKYLEMITADKAIHFVAEYKNEIIACAGGFIKDNIPYCFFNDSEYGFIGDVYVYPEYRNNKIATKLTKEVLNWLKSKNIKTVKLMATNEGKKLYENLGFKYSDEMILNI